MHAVLYPHKGLDRHGAQPQAQGVAQCAVGVRKAKKQVLMVVVWRAVHHFAIGQQHIDFQQRVVHQPVAVRTRLNAHAGHRTADGDGLELRHHRRYDTLGKRFGHQLLVSGQTLDIDPALRSVDLQYMAKAAEVHPLPGAALAVPEQIGFAFAQPQRIARPVGGGPHGRHQAGAALGMAGRLRRHTEAPGPSGSWRTRCCPC